MMQFEAKEGTSRGWTGRSHGDGQCERMRSLSTDQEPSRFWKNASWSRGIDVTRLPVLDGRELSQLPLWEVLYLQGPVNLHSFCSLAQVLAF